MTVSSAALVMAIVTVLYSALGGPETQWDALGPQEWAALALYGVGSLAISQILWIMAVGQLGIGLSALHMNAVPFYVMLIMFCVWGGLELAANLWCGHRGGRRDDCPRIDPVAEMITLSQSPTDPAFVQDPYPFYERARAAGPFFLWEDYGLVCTTNAAATNAIFRDRRFGRESPVPLNIPDHLAPVLRRRGAFHAGAGAAAPHPPAVLGAARLHLAPDRRPAAEIADADAIS